MRYALFSLMLSCLLAPATAAISQEVSPPPTLPEATSSDDIVVRALRIPRNQLPTGVYWDYQTILSSRIVRENAEMFMRCALTKGERESLRKVVDGEPNSATARFAQGWISQRHQGCYPPVRRIGVMTTNQPATIAQMGESLVDRGVIIESTLHRYAPDAELTPELTNDPAVESRFIAREGVRNRLRLANDRDALVLTACLVKRQPVLATRLMRSDPGSDLEQGLTQAILLEGRACLGGVRRVTIDPTLVRIYIADAFYRWVVAARGVDSLIPADAEG